MAREAKFTFIPARQITDRVKETGLAATISTQSGQMRLLGTDPDEMRNRYASFYLELHKKALGWRYFEKGSVAELKQYKKIQVSAKGVVSVSISKELKAFNLDGA